MSSLTALIRSDSGRVFEAHTTRVWFIEHKVAIGYKAEFNLPWGTYTHAGIRYPDGHETWNPSTPQSIGMWGSPLTMDGEIVVR